MDGKQSARLTPRLGFHRVDVDLVRDDACVRPVDGARWRGASLARWLTDNGNLEIEIAPCGAALYGTVTKVLAIRSMSGGGEMVAAKQQFAPRHEDPQGFRAVRRRRNGEIYNRENAKTYSCKITLGGPELRTLVFSSG